MTNGQWVKEGTIDNFMEIVITQSRQILILVNFWADWEPQSKSFNSLLEKIIHEAKGRIVLVKMNADQNPEIIQQMRIQTLPAAYLFKDGRPLDGFVGAISEKQIRIFLEKHLGGALNADEALDSLCIEGLQALEQGDLSQAETIFKSILLTNKMHCGAIAGTIKVLIAQRNFDLAQTFVETLTPELAKKSEILAAITSLNVIQEAQKISGNLSQYEDVLMKNPKDHQCRYALSIGLFAMGKHQEALDHLLELFRFDREWNDGAARKQLVTFFDALGPSNSLMIQARKRLSSMMFS